MIVEHLFVGGISFMLPIYLMWIAVIILSVKFLINYFSKNKDLQKLAKQNSLILFLGSFAFLFGLLGQILGLYGALQAIQSAGDISPAIMAGGLRVSLIAPLYGLVLLVISSIIWFVFRNLVKK
jgi:biopolymer transport protein ExbB/TolQ